MSCIPEREIRAIRKTNGKDIRTELEVRYRPHIYFIYRPTQIFVFGVKNMTRSRCLLLASALLMVALQPVVVIAGGRTVSISDTQILFGSQLLHSDQDCLFVDGNVTSETFFYDLKRIDAGGKFAYRKGGQAISTYPTALSTSIRVMGNQCGPMPAAESSAIFSRNSYSLKFKVSWKDGMELRPATFSASAASCHGFNSTTIPDRGYSIPTVTCQLMVDGAGVPLTDHLIVSVFTPDGELLTRLSAAP